MPAPLITGLHATCAFSVDINFKLSQNSHQIKCKRKELQTFQRSFLD